MLKTNGKRNSQSKKPPGKSLYNRRKESSGLNSEATGPKPNTSIGIRPPWNQSPSAGRCPRHFQAEGDVGAHSWDGHSHRGSCALSPAVRPGGRPGSTAWIQPVSVEHAPEEEAFWMHRVSAQDGQVNGSCVNVHTTPCCVKEGREHPYTQVCTH